MEVSKNLIIPLFPLNAVLFPGGALPLKIFEPRYLDMVSDCMKKESGIGVVMIKSGNEAGIAAQTHEVGTISHISYWHKRNDGMLGITLTGKQRFRVLSTEIKPNQLITAEIEILPDYDLSDMDKIKKQHEEQQLVNLLKQIIAQLEPPFTTMTKKYNDMEWVSARLIELLPLRLADKQELLTIINLNDRLRYLYPLLVSMELI